MRLSCNGCRVLRKGWTADCPIRPCLHWIKSPESQANATVFLAKFYCRAGLINLINATAPPLRPATFKSLLHEACGRIVNPIFGCIGLLSSGRWHLCEAAVEAILNGAPIMQDSSELASMLKACDIRHVAKKGNSNSCASNLLHKVNKSRSPFKRTKPQSQAEPMNRSGTGNEFHGSLSLDSGSGVSEHNRQWEADSCSVQTVEAKPPHHGDVQLDLTLGWGSVKTSVDINGPDVDTCTILKSNKLRYALFGLGKNKIKK